MNLQKHHIVIQTKNFELIPGEFQFLILEKDLYFPWFVVSFDKKLRNLLNQGLEFFKDVFGTGMFQFNLMLNHQLNETVKL